MKIMKFILFSVCLVQISQISPISSIKNTSKIDRKKLNIHNELSHSITIQCKQMDPTTVKIIASHENNGKKCIIGVAFVVKLSDERACLNSLYVEDQYRNLGYGAILFEQAYRQCRNYGCKKMTWDAVSTDSGQSDIKLQYNNLKLERFYKKQGAQKDKLTGEWYKDL